MIERNTYYVRLELLPFRQIFFDYIYFRIDLVDRAVGPINGDVYTVVNPSTNKETNGKVL